MLSLCLIASAAGCGKSKSAKPGGGTSAALHIISAPVHNTQVGGALTYQAVLSQPGAAEWTIEQGPHGAKIEQGGALTWAPDPTQGGDQTFMISAKVADLKIDQTFVVTAATSVVEVSAHVDPKDPNGASVVVDAPLSAAHGSALQVDPGALPPGEPVAVSISSMQHAPDPPAVKMGNVLPSDLRPVELGPTGLAFKKPAKLQLPIPAKLVGRPNLTVQTYDYATGQWKKAKVVSVDMQAGVMVAEVQHFSTYVVTPDVKVFNLELGLGGAGSACGDALVVRAPLVPRFADVPASAVNGYAGAAATVADVLAALPAGQALQIYTRVRARASAATGEQTGWLLAAASKQDDGKLKVTVTSDSHAGAFLAVPAGGLAATDPELLAWMNGSRADFVFGALGALAGGAVANAEASLYLVPAGDAELPPPASANAIGTEEVEVATLAPLPDVDDDCDGAPNAWDPEPRGAAPPVLVGVPAGPVHVAVGSPVAFKISSPQDGVTFAWSASDPAVTIVSAANGAVGTATADVPGLFHVTVTGTRGAASSRFTWDVIADPAAVADANTPPLVAVSASANVVRVGEAVTLRALGKDAEQAALTFAWAASDATVLSAQLGETVVFSAPAPGDYVVTCLANDGSASSAPATVTLTVLSAMANRPPGMPSVSPLGAALTRAPGATVSLTLTAKADDPDGDVLTYDFAPDPSTPPTFTLTTSGASAAFSASQDGVYVFYVTATDPNGARSPWALVKILVVPSMPPGVQVVDADKDGYPAGFDCNDADATVHPGAKEICGDGKDQDCDGRDLAGAQCDVDGDRFSPAQGDCDDKNPAIGPQMPERCDGIDNNCNQMVDEGFSLGAACANGVGACQVAAKTICSTSFGGVVCGGVPGQPQTETCDGVDNDCNGRVDDVPGQLGGDARNCGGCGIACPALANSTAACLAGGCVSMCAPGFVDADRNPANGCECQLTNGGVEICDGVDNDCNGAVDEGAGALKYTGPAGTMGVGVCAAGVQLCQGGQLVDARPSQVPSTEVCDGLDNDCNGKVDDGFDLMNDSKNCGGCGVVCAGGFGCQLGRCPGGGGTDGGVGPGPDGGPGGTLKLCGDATGGMSCVDISTDLANCGGCGHACGATQYCGGGLCIDFPAVTCGAGQTPCSDALAPGKMYCTDLKNDARNCNACGAVCPNGAVCQDGACVGGATGDGGVNVGTDGGATLACPAVAPDACPGPQNSTYCSDLMRNASDCGTCGHVCGAGMVCDVGTCMPGGATGTCTPPGLTCASPDGQNTYCTDPTKDPGNCGGCGHFCPGGLACQGGACGGQPVCGAPLQTCPDPTGHPFCTDTSRDPGNCGGCGKPCAANAICTNGTCQGGGGSYPGLAACSAAGGAPMCTNLYSDPGNCGRCGTSCAAGQGCFGGQCGTAPPPPVCPADAQICSDPTGTKMYCANVMFDGGNCGRCGNVCPGGSGCNNGVCTAGGTTDGGVAQTCLAPSRPCPNAAGGMTCADVRYDNANCGGCGFVCPVSTICMNGACTVGGSADGGPPPPNCPANMIACFPAAGPGYCSDLNFDTNNCGSCFKQCPAGYFCQAATCMPQAGQDGGAPPPPDGGGITCNPPQVPCDNAYCTDFKTDMQNCGGCHIMCQATQQCYQGGCITP